MNTLSFIPLHFIFLFIEDSLFRFSWTWRNVINTPFPFFPLFFPLRVYICTANTLLSFFSLFFSFLLRCTLPPRVLPFHTSAHGVMMNTAFLNTLPWKYILCSISLMRFLHILPQSLIIVVFFFPYLLISMLVTANTRLRCFCIITWCIRMAFHFSRAFYARYVCICSSPLF